jgi:tetratricopeptide (TPR) repeat protein
VLPERSDADLRSAWDAWYAAFTGLSPSAEEGAQKELLALREELGITDLEAFSTALARASALRMTARDPMSGVLLASTAVELSPSLPYARFALARAYFQADPADVGRWMGAFFQTLGQLAGEPRYALPILADVLGALLFALLATALAIVGVLFGRKVRYFLHDAHHLLPTGALRWQSSVLALLVLSLPLVFRMGVLPVLLVLFAAATLYLPRRERLVAAAAIGLLALLPLGAGGITALTSFSGTVAEDVYQLERGGLSAQKAADHVRGRLALGHASFEELFALGRYELRRGKLPSATDALKMAAPLRPDDGRVPTLLGNVRFAAGDLEGAQSLYGQAAASSPRQPAAFYNLGQLHLRRARALSGVAELQERERGQQALATAADLDGDLGAKAEAALSGPPLLNRVLLSPGLSGAEVARLARPTDAASRVQDQLAWSLLGMPSGALSTALPLLLVLGLVGFGTLGGRLGASRGCGKCGRSVCRRCDPELGAGSALCGQCVNAFTKKGVVAPQVKVRKQLEVERRQAASERLTWILGFACSGAGHLFSGFPVRGALYTFGFMFAVSLAVLREGLLRAPWGELPMALRLVPVGVLAILVYLLSLHSLRKAQTR